MQRPELLAPAGNMEKLRIAVHYGADAVYLGGQAFGLRNMADNFSVAEMGAALDFCHAKKIRAYLTINSYPRNESLPELEEYLAQIATLPFDAYIVADPGVIDAVRQVSPERELALCAILAAAGGQPDQPGPGNEPRQHPRNGDKSTGNGM